MITKKEVIEAANLTHSLAVRCGEQTIQVRGAINKLKTAIDALDSAIPQDREPEKKQAEKKDQKSKSLFSSKNKKDKPSKK